MASPPKPQEGTTLLHHEDYPTSAVDRLAVGDVHARLSVNASGSATSCTLTKSSGHADIDAAVCKSVMKRAKFQPALDRDGKPMDALYFLSSRWRLSV